MRELSDEQWIEMAQDPGMQALRQYVDGSLSFNDKEFAMLLKVTFPAFVDGDEEGYEGLNEAFVTWKMYRLHESILTMAIAGYLKVKGIDKAEAHSLDFDMIELASS